MQNKFLSIFLNNYATNFKSNLLIMTGIISKEVFQCLVQVISLHELSQHLRIRTQRNIISAADSVNNAHPHYSTLYTNIIECYVPDTYPIVAT
jgi:hypothetical protein